MIIKKYEFSIHGRIPEEVTKEVESAEQVIMKLADQDDSRPSLIVYLLTKWTDGPEE